MLQINAGGEVPAKPVTHLTDAQPTRACVGTHAGPKGASSRALHSSLRRPTAFRAAAARSLRGKRVYLSLFLMERKTVHTVDFSVKREKKGAPFLPFTSFEMVTNWHSLPQLW